MIYDFHTHTFFSDGINSPIELIRCADSYGYSCIALTDHASLSNIEQIIKNVTKDCELAKKYWDIIAIPGVELTNVPAKSIGELARYAKEQGARIVTVHGQTLAEPVEPGTNKEAVSSIYVDMLAHPGIITKEEAELAFKNNIFIELTHRSGHCLSNGHVANISIKTGAKLLINSDAHSHLDLYRNERQINIALGAGLTKKQADEIFKVNNNQFLKKLGY